jgi:hypothetical protein
MAALIVSLIVVMKAYRYRQITLNMNNTICGFNVTVLYRRIGFYNAPARVTTTNKCEVTTDDTVPLAPLLLLLRYVGLGATPNLVRSGDVA